ncbi:MAG: hypothetical protein Crog3KO_11650 [Crocinitomicaceae bacterium]
MNSILLLTVKQIELNSVSFFLVQTIGAFFPIAIYVFAFSLLEKKIHKYNIVFLGSYVVALIPIYYFAQFLLLDYQDQLQYFEQLRSGTYPDSIALYNIIFYTFQQFVFAWLLRFCYRFKRKKEAALFMDKIYYLQVFLWAFVFSNTFLLLASVFFDVLFVEYLLLPIALIIIHSSTIYYGFKNPAILSNNESRGIEANDWNRTKVNSNSKSTITPEEFNELEERIINGLSHLSIHKDADMSLSKMAEILDTPAYKLSKTINEKMDTNFNDLINSKRIDASLVLLEKNKQFTIESIAQEVGFKSKSTFYRAFKKNKGITPSQYLLKK